MGEVVSHPEWRDELLARLDEAAEWFMFPGLPNEYFALADLRLTVFRSDEEWLTVFEAVGWSIRDAAFHNQVKAYGNRLEKQGLQAAIEVVPGAFDAEDRLQLDLDRLQVEIRGRRHELRPSAADLRKARVEDAAMPEPARVIRVLATLLGDELFLSDDELLEICGRAGAGLTPFLKARGWRQPDLIDDEKPSDVACLQSLADAIAEGDPGRFDCAESEWNTQWWHWED